MTTALIILTAAATIAWLLARHRAADLAAQRDDLAAEADDLRGEVREVRAKLAATEANFDRDYTWLHDELVLVAAEKRAEIKAADQLARKLASKRTAGKKAVRSS